MIFTNVPPANRSRSMNTLDICAYCFITTGTIILHERLPMAASMGRPG